MYWGMMGQGITYASSVESDIRAFESEDYDGTRINVRKSYIALRNQPTRLRITKTNIT